MGFLAGLCCLAPAAPAQPREARGEAFPRVLYYEAFPFPSDPVTGTARIDIHYRIDREFFVPVRDPDGPAPFHRSGEVVAELADSTGETAARAMASLDIPEQSADRAPPGTLWEQGILRVEVRPGRYRVNMTLDDSESRRTVRDSAGFVQASPRHGAGLSTASLALVAPPPGARLDTLRLMNYGDNVLFGRASSLLVLWRGGKEIDSTLSVRYAFDEVPPAPEDAPFIPSASGVTVPVRRGVTLAVLTDSGGVGYAVSPSPGGTLCAAVVPMPFAALPLRAYRLALTLRSGADARELKESARTLWPDMPFSLKEIDNALDALKYITTAQELDSLRRGDIAGRRAHLEGFWRAHGAVPGSALNPEEAEYYRRVDYATRSFGTLRQPDGFRSDRGRIYVLYGPPSSTERTLDPVAGHREVWTYLRQRRKFVFLDESKSGNFILVSSGPL
jgi:GWxTD domain-containing protein